MLLFCLLIIAVAQDIRSGKISNRLIAAGCMIGFFVQLIEYQISGVYYFLRNISVPVILLYLLFQMRVLGAGDIKLFSMIGSILTIQELYRCMMIGFLASGIGAGFCLVFRKNWRLHLIHAVHYLYTLFKNKEVSSYIPLEEAETWKFAFSVPILFGVIGALYFPAAR
ncbi:MAG: prepilin peptidase [Lachnospiraceae bacterium]|nr:prepilin peptidase [Lachnospiraceae bacterium]